MVFDDIDHSVGFLLNDVSRLLRKRFHERASDLKLTRAQWRVLVHLAPRAGINQSSLAEILEVENITLGRHIDRLEETGLVERRRDPADRRAWRLYVTDKARPLIDRMEALAVVNQEEAMTGLAEADREHLIGMLIRIKANLLRPETAEAPSEADDEPVVLERAANVG